MKILKNESLKKYTTIKIGGIAKELFFPDSEDNLKELLDSIVQAKIYILGGGSNLLINNEKIFERVICLKELDNRIEKLDNGKYYIGASVSLQTLIKTTNEDGYGGIEYLFSVPALVGGAIVMNAGRGKIHNLAISDYIQEVYVYDYDTKEKTIYQKEDCDFSYRNSRFKNGKVIILGATFKFEHSSKDELVEKRKDRTTLVRKVQDSSGGYNFGSVFKKNNRYLMQLIKLFNLGYTNGVSFSSKTSNWLINKGDGNFKQAIKLINYVEILHKLCFQKIEKEVIIWD